MIHNQKDCNINGIINRIIKQKGCFIMTKKQTSLTTIMVVQQLEEEYWLSSDYKKPLQDAKNGNCLPLLKHIVEKLESNGIISKEAYIIKHDKDVQQRWSPEAMKTIAETKNEHIHALLKFEKGATLEKIALSINVEPQYLEKMKSGRYGYDNCLAYLVHAKDENKHQYQPEEVFTLLGEDYTSLYHRQMETWIKGRATKKAKATKLSIDWLIEQILEGKITKNNILLTDEYYTIYGQYKRQINDALDTAGERKSFRAISDIENEKFKKTIIFISARSGVGKTKFGKHLIKLLHRIANKFNENWDFCLTASTNAFDEYNGQEILFLDDIRSKSFSISDWLKLLDPYMISPISARYHNKMGAAKVIIITSTKPPLKFFEETKNANYEDLGQFIRRFDYLLEIKENFILYEPMKKSINDMENKIYETSFEFSNESQNSLNNTLDKLVKKVISNMKWNKKGYL